MSLDHEGSGNSHNILAHIIHLFNRKFTVPKGTLSSRYHCTSMESFLLPNSNFSSQILTMIAPASNDGGYLCLCGFLDIESNSFNFEGEFDIYMLSKSTAICYVGDNGNQLYGERDLLHYLHYFLFQHRRFAFMKDLIGSINARVTVNLIFVLEGDDSVRALYLALKIPER